MVLDFKKNKVVLSVLPWTCWLVSASDVGWAVLACVCLLGCVRQAGGAGVRVSGGGGRQFLEHVRSHL